VIVGRRIINHGRWVCSPWFMPFHAMEAKMEAKIEAKMGAKMEAKMEANHEMVALHSNVLSFRIYYLMIRFVLLFVTTTLVRSYTTNLWVEYVPSQHPRSGVFTGTLWYRKPWLGWGSDTFHTPLGIMRTQCPSLAHLLEIYPKQQRGFGM